MREISTTPLLKVKESLYKQCEVTPHFSTRYNLFKKIFRKDNL